jgi:hypothetical protein
MDERGSPKSIRSDSSVDSYIYVSPGYQICPGEKSQPSAIVPRVRLRGWINVALPTSTEPTLSEESNSSPSDFEIFDRKTIQLPNPNSSEYNYSVSTQPTTKRAIEGIHEVNQLEKGKLTFIYRYFYHPFLYLSARYLVRRRCWKPLKPWMM